MYTIRLGFHYIENIALCLQFTPFHFNDILGGGGTGLFAGAFFILLTSELWSLLNALENKNENRRCTAQHQVSVYLNHKTNNRFFGNEWFSHSLLYWVDSKPFLFIAICQFLFNSASYNGNLWN